MNAESYTLHDFALSLCSASQIAVSRKSSTPETTMNIECDLAFIFGTLTHKEKNGRSNYIRTLEL